MPTLGAPALGLIVAAVWDGARALACSKPDASMAVGMAQPGGVRGSRSRRSAFVHNPGLGCASLIVSPKPALVPACRAGFGLTIMAHPGCRADLPTSGTSSPPPC